jgi:hypothetical protein
MRRDKPPCAVIAILRSVRRFLTMPKANPHTGVACQLRALTISSKIGGGFGLLDDLARESGVAGTG